MCHFQEQNGPFVLNIFLGGGGGGGGGRRGVQTIINTFIYLLALLIVQNLQKNSYGLS